MPSVWPARRSRYAAGSVALLELLKKNGRTWHDLQKIMAVIEAEKEAAAAAAALATRAAGWKKGPDGNDLGIPNNDLLALAPPTDRDLRLSYGRRAHNDRALDLAHARLSSIPLHTATPGRQPDRKLREDDGVAVDRTIGLRTRSPAASIYHQLERTPGTTLLIDEADNLNVFNDPKMRQVFNYGHEVDGD
jgi:hypothetical protein